MKRLFLTSLLCIITPILSVSAFAVDGVVLINQATVMAAGGFPYQINNSGSYRLSGNLVVSAGADGIDINASNVTLDLNGFAISGPGSCTGSGATISCQNESGVGISCGGNAPTQVTIRNGTVTGFRAGVGILAFDEPADALIEEIRAHDNNTGIDFEGIVGGSAVLRRNVASRNSIYGILCYGQNGGCVVTDNAANFNGSIGISTFFSTVTENVANSNALFGLNMNSSGLFGSNTLELNGTGPVFSPGVSQKNNDCSGSSC